MCDVLAEVARQQVAALDQQPLGLLGTAHLQKVDAQHIARTGEPRQVEHADAGNAVFPEHELAGLGHDAREDDAFLARQRGGALHADVVELADERDVVARDLERTEHRTRLHARDAERLGHLERLDSAPAAREDNGVGTLELAVAQPQRERLALLARRINGRHVRLATLAHAIFGRRRAQHVDDDARLVRERVLPPVGLLAPREAEPREEPVHAIGPEPPVQRVESIPDEPGVEVFPHVDARVREIAAPITRRQDGPPHALVALENGNLQRRAQLARPPPRRDSRRQPGRSPADDRQSFPILSHAPIIGTGQQPRSPLSHFSERTPRSGSPPSRTGQQPPGALSDITPT